jgi:hypothetical protein
MMMSSCHGQLSTQQQQQQQQLLLPPPLPFCADFPDK